MRTRLFLLGCVFTAITAPADSVFHDDVDTTRSSRFPPKLKDGHFPRHYRPDRTVDTKHIRLEIHVDFDNQRIAGEVHFDVTPIHEDIDSVRLDAVGLTIDDVLLEHSTALDYDYVPDQEELIVHLPDGIGKRDGFTLSVRYNGAPRENFYWRDTKSTVGVKNADMCFTLNEPRGASSWFPCLDYPSDRFTCEIIATVPKGFVSIANGKLQEKTVSPDGDWETHHWSMKHEVVTYLMSLVVGKYGVASDMWRGIPVEYYCMPGHEDDAHASMGMTPDMLTLYSDIFGVVYPYSKYAQVPVKDFPAGGMEHTTCTTMHENLVVDKRARLDHDEESLIAHELVHQWFGDLLTCESWPHLWLNESFASYFDPVWYERSRGQDEFLRRMHGTASNYIGGSGRYTRAIVTNNFDSAEEMFDHHSYPKGACVLHMLRQELGDKLFFRAIQHYCRKHQDTLVDTDDFQEACEEATGRTLDRFFEQWIYRPGHPKLKVEWKWRGKDKEVHLTTKQTQTMEEGAQPFHFPLVVRIHTEDDVVERTVRVTQLEQTFQIVGSDEPKSIDVNPDLTVLMELDFKKSKAMLLYEAEYGKSVITRFRAIQKLAEHDTDDSVEALAKALAQDSFWWTQAEAATSLGKIGTQEAKQALLDAADHEHPKVRRSIASALGKFYKDEAVQKALEEMVEDDPSVHVAATAITSLGSVRLPQSKRLLRRNLKIDSYAQRIRSAAISALVKFQDTEALSAIRKLAETGPTRWVRTSAISAMGTLGKELPESKQEDILEELLMYLADEQTRIRRAAAGALGTLGNDDAIPLLRARSDDDPNYRVRDAAGRAVKDIRDSDSNLAKKNAGRVDQLADKQKELEKTIKDLKKELEETRSDKE